MSAVKRGVKKIGRALKKVWKPLVIAAAVVFTAGAAAGGLAAMKGAFATKGIIGGIGTTMKAGMSAIGAVFKGGGIAGAKSAAGATFGTTAKVAGTAAKGVAGATTAGKTAAATTKTAAATTGKAATSATAAGKAGTAAATTGKAATAATTTKAAAAGTAGKTAAAISTAAPAAAAAPSFWSGLGGQALIGGGIQAATALLAGQAADDEENKPLAYWGRDARDGTGGLTPQQVGWSPGGQYGSPDSWSAPPSARRLMLDPNAA